MTTPVDLADGLFEARSPAPRTFSELFRIMGKY